MPSEPDVYERADRFWQALEPLGPFRQQVISCLRGNMGLGPHAFSAQDGQDLFEAFRMFVTRHQTAALPELDQAGHAILAAGQLLTGDLTGADRIIDLLPVKPHVTDHGAGKCLLMPMRVLRRVVPFPADVGDPDHWTAGSPDQAALRSWLAQHRQRLLWMEVEGQYRFDVISAARSTSVGL